MSAYTWALWAKTLPAVRSCPYGSGHQSMFRSPSSRMVLAGVLNPSTLECAKWPSPRSRRSASRSRPGRRGPPRTQAASHGKRGGQECAPRPPRPPCGAPPKCAAEWSCLGTHSSAAGVSHGGSRASRGGDTQPLSEQILPRVLKNVAHESNSSQHSLECSQQRFGGQIFKIIQLHDKRRSSSICLQQTL